MKRKDRVESVYDVIVSKIQELGYAAVVKTEESQKETSVSVFVAKSGGDAMLFLIGGAPEGSVVHVDALDGSFGDIDNHPDPAELDMAKILAGVGLGAK